MDTDKIISLCARIDAESRKMDALCDEVQSIIKEINAHIQAWELRYMGFHDTADVIETPEVKIETVVNNGIYIGGKQ